jgi:hypothetical protein
MMLGAGDPQRFPQDHRNHASGPCADRDPDRHLATAHCCSGTQQRAVD